MLKCLLPTFFEVILSTGAPKIKQMPPAAVPQEVKDLVPAMHAGCKAQFPKEPNICAVGIYFEPETGKVSVECE